MALFTFLDIIFFMSTFQPFQNGYSHQNAPFQSKVIAHFPKDLKRQIDKSAPKCDHSDFENWYLPNGSTEFNKIPDFVTLECPL